MIVRSLVLIGAVVGGIAVGSLVPDLSQAVRSTLASLPLPGLAASREAEPARPLQARPEATSSRSRTESPGTTGALDGALKLTPEQIALARIGVAAAQSGQLQRHITVPGTIVPASDRIARIPAKVVGTVADLRKRLGDPVTQGEVVAVLDSREVADAQSEYLTASVNLDLQRTAFERAQSLWEKRIVAESQYLQARAAYTEAQLRIELARQKLLTLQLAPDEVAEAARQAQAQPSAAAGSLRLSQYQIRSPATGRVVERKVDVGASVGQQNDPSELYTLVDLTVVWAELAVSTADLASVKQGQRVDIATGGGQRAEGRIVFVSPLLDKETRSARVVAEIANPDETWKPGLFVTAEIVIEDQAPKVAVPRSALQTVGGTPVVFVRTPEGFQKRAVTLGRGDDRSVEITAGLEPGETIAVANSFALKAELGRSQLEE